MHILITYSQSWLYLWYLGLAFLANLREHKLTLAFLVYKRLVKIVGIVSGKIVISFKAVATPAIFYSHWQLDILKTVLRHTCSQVSLQVSSISATYCKKFNLMNILQHCPSDFVAERDPDTCETFWFYDPCNIRKKCLFVLPVRVKMSNV